MIADGNMVGMQFRIKGTHQGNFFGIPATGRSIDIQEVAIMRLEDGKIVAGWFMADEVELLKQLGVGLPPRRDGPTTNTCGAVSSTLSTTGMQTVSATRASVRRFQTVRTRSITCSPRVTTSGYSSD